MPLLFNKPRPKLLDKREKAAALATQDRIERAKCRARSFGRCEVMEFDLGFNGNVFRRCTRRATENHHLLGGSGRRNRGRSILSEHRLCVCTDHHREITGHVLVPVGLQNEREWAATVRYERRAQ